jgi:hypothetical protein
MRHGLTSGCLLELSGIPFDFCNPKSLWCFTAADAQSPKTPSNKPKLGTGLLSSFGRPWMQLGQPWRAEFSTEGPRKLDVVVYVELIGAPLKAIRLLPIKAPSKFGLPGVSWKTVREPQ